MVVESIRWEFSAPTVFFRTKGSWIQRTSARNVKKRIRIYSDNKLNERIIRKDCFRSLKCGLVWKSVHIFTSFNHIQCIYLSDSFDKVQTFTVQQTTGITVKKVWLRGGLHFKCLIPLGVEICVVGVKITPNFHSGRPDIMQSVEIRVNLIVWGIM